jgi:hypothetical protein
MGKYPPAEIRLGSTLLWQGSGIGFEILSRLIKRCDPDLWIRYEWDRWGWHLAQVVGRTNDGDWIIDEARAPQSHIIALSLCKGEYKVINWLDHAPKMSECSNFVMRYPDFSYDSISYLWTLLNRITRGVFPKIANKMHNCWERNGCFNEMMGKPPYLDYEMAYMPLMLKRYFQAHDTSPVIGIILNKKENTR